MIIISGNSRSGTTMMGRILGNHPGVFTFQELHFFDELVNHHLLHKSTSAAILSKLFARLIAVQRNGYFGSRDFHQYHKEATNNIEKHQPSTPAETYKLFLELETALNKSTIPCEQTPQNLFSLDQLFTIFPQAKAVIMIRDPREVLLSQKHKWKRRRFTRDNFPLTESIRAFMNYHPVTMSRLWHAAAETTMQWKKDPRVLIVRFEDLIRESEKTVRSICTHCNIEFSDLMLEIPVVGSSNAGDSLTRKGIDSDRTGKWKTGLRAAEVKICQDINGELMSYWGYEPVPIVAGALWVAVYKITMPLKLILSLPFNIRRLSDPAAIWKRISSK